MKMPFGKYRGIPIEDLPDDYLDSLSTIDLRAPLQDAVEMESDRRNSHETRSGERQKRASQHLFVSSMIMIPAGDRS
jgi:hypothetical protein